MRPSLCFVYCSDPKFITPAVTGADITPYQVPPTGVVRITLTSGETMNIQVTDVAPALSEIRHSAGSSAAPVHDGDHHHNSQKT